ncbi:hypothetical protein HYU92_01585 [Candidatus Curtissbacteria bacterium]|nr:hypothetical protein [Candidatus Curtissbacteria bacterium]
MDQLAQIGTITPPSGIPTTNGDPTGFVASLIRNSVWLVIIVAFIVALFMFIFAGYRFIFAGDDPKTMASAWSQIYLGLLGLVIVVGAFAIIKLVEIFFGVDFITGGLRLPIR